jgi:hypothetical protein
MRKIAALVVGVVTIIAGSIALASADPTTAPSTAAQSWGRTLSALSPHSVTTIAIPADETIVLTFQETNFQFIDVGPGPAGDYFVLRENVFDESGTRVGFTSIQCTVHFRGDLLCHAALTLPGRGQIEVYGHVPESARFTIAVTGGTGDFANVGGELLVELDTGRYTFYLLALN